MKRFMSIWFPFLVAERLVLRDPSLRDSSFVTTITERGKVMVNVVSAAAMKEGIAIGSTIADVRAIAPSIKTFPHPIGIEEKLLTKLAEWCLQFTPIAAIDLPNGIVLDISGCAHLWGGEAHYLNHIVEKIQQKGFSIKCAIADTVGAAWALSRFGQSNTITPPGQQYDAIAPLPPVALRLERSITDKMQKLGFNTIGSFCHIPQAILRRRFGESLLLRLRQIQGEVPELIKMVQPEDILQKRLACLQPIRTRVGIDIALKTLLEQVCHTLADESKGLRAANFKCFRIDGIIQQISIGTNRPVRNPIHLLKLFEQKIETIRPGLGIETFLLEAPVTEDLMHKQDSLWSIINQGKEKNSAISDLFDRIAGKIGTPAIKRYLPTEQHWPERSYKAAVSVFESTNADWSSGKLRPIMMLRNPVIIKVTAPIPDYPPILFIHNGKVHRIKKADGPERIEREWWLEKGLVRDYYCLEDEAGARYWVFRSGHYESQNPEWFIHGYFA